jgi:spermidine/putrescine transport system substrate-binding protein
VGHDRLSAALSRRRLLRQAGKGALGLSALGALAAAEVAEAATTLKFINYVKWIGKDEYKNFKAATGIGVKEIVVNSGSERVSKIQQDPKVADMVLLDLHTGGRLDALGRIAKLDLSRIPNFKNVNPAFKQGLASAKQAKAIPTDYGRIGILYRTDMVSEPITKWADLWKLASKYSGKIALEDNQIGLTQVALLKLGYDGNSTKEAEVHKAGDELIKLKPHVVGLFESDMAKPMVDGSAAMGMVEDWAGNAAILENPKLPLKFVNPLDGMPGYLDIWVALKGDHQAEVQQFMNYHLTPKVTANFVNTLACSSIMPAASPFLSPKLRKNAITNPPPSIYKRVAFQEFLGEAQRYWDDEWARFKSA